MQAHMSAGLSAAEAARAALAGEAIDGVVAVPAKSPGAGGSSELEASAAALRAALVELDRERAEFALDRLLATFTFETVATAVMLPYLVDVGGRWARGETSVAEEHLAAQVLRGRLFALMRGRPAGARARAVLACPPDEQHDIALVMLSVALERRAWHVTLLGANTPIESIEDAARRSAADCVVLAIALPERISANATELSRLAGERPLLLAGAGVDEERASAVGAVWLQGDPIDAAGRLDRWLADRQRPGAGLPAVV
jgi:methanogenic corrinoid protein MtbC1